MATKPLNACAFTPTTGGTGTWTVSAAIQGYLTPANADAIDGATYSYRAENATKTEWEIGTGVYTASGTTLTRTPKKSSNSNAAVNFTSAPNIYVTALAEDLAGYIVDWLGTTTLGARLWHSSFSTYTTATGGNGTVWYVPVLIKKPFSSCSIHFNLTTVSGNASATASVGIYDSLNGAPNNRLGQVTGIPTGTGVGVTGDNSSGTISLGATYPPGLYWLAYVGATAAATLETAGGSATSWLMREIVGASDTTDITVTPKGYTQSNAGLPATASSLTLSSGTVPYLGVNC